MLLAMGMRHKKESTKCELTDKSHEEDIQARDNGEYTDKRMARICKPAMAPPNEDLDFNVETTRMSTKMGICPP